MLPDPDAPVLDWARFYLSHGLSVIPVRADGSKAPTLGKDQVAQYRERFATAEELAGWFAPHRAVGLAVVCGKVSGNLVVLDFESATAWERWADRARPTPVWAAVSQSPQVQTPKGGRHVYCRIRDTFVSGHPLARRDKTTLLIETRGEGHYVLAPGCPPACHELNRPYRLMATGWLVREGGAARAA